jgi:hypothetical protein
VLKIGIDGHEKPKFFMAKKAELELDLFFYENPSYSLDSHTYVILGNQKHKNKSDRA